MLPEEAELSRYEAEQRALEEQLVACELALETATAEVEQFRRRYYRVVGTLYAKLDKLEAELAQLHLRQAPGDSSRQARARAAADQAERSAREAGMSDDDPALRAEVTEELKNTYRQAVKLLHPDLTLDNDEKQRRTVLMAAVNAAYKRGDLKAIERLIQQHREDPAAVQGTDTGARIIRAIRTITQLRARITELEAELKSLRASEIFLLKLDVEAQEAAGADPLGQLANTLTAQIREKELALAP